MRNARDILFQILTKKKKKQLASYIEENFNFNSNTYNTRDISNLIVLFNLISLKNRSNPDAPLAN